MSFDIVLDVINYVVDTDRRTGTDERRGTMFKIGVYARRPIIANVALTTDSLTDFKWTSLR